MYQNEFSQLRHQSLQLRQKPLSSRLELLEKLYEGLCKYQDAFVEALEKDFHKPEAEVLLTEFLPLFQELKDAKKNLKRWASPQRVSTPITQLSSQAWIQYEPKGVVLIIAPWNYPLQLAIAPLIPALAAGNCVILKPSELTPHTSATIKSMLEEFLPRDVVCVIEGGVETSTELLKLPFDHIFFTGSTPVGKVIMQAAAKNLTPVTLELGGKSPTLILEDADLNLAAEKILWGKFVNSGQTCVAPDYVLVPTHLSQNLTEKLRQQHQVFAAQKPTAIISQRHADRQRSLAQEVSPHSPPLGLDRFVEFAILENPKASQKIMQEEIFGPLLPMIPYSNLNEALDYINQHDKPLALYIFGKDKSTIEKILKSTSSGGVAINETLLHVAHPHLPFGGIGPSGMGNYHGEFGFKTFSHSKAVLKQGPLGFMMRQFYPPYTDKKIKLVRWLLKILR